MASFPESARGSTTAKVAEFADVHAATGLTHSHSHSLTKHAVQLRLHPHTMPLSTPSLLRRSLILVLPTLVAACGGSRVTRSDEVAPGTGSGATTIVTIEPSTKYQELEGFGASVAWYANFFTAHPNRDRLATLLFKDLGLDILRLRNQYRAPGDQPDPLGIELYRAATESLGHPPRVLLTSWSPPAALKASGRTDCKSDDTDQTCTLRRNDDGSFPYGEFAQYWLESLQAYHALGLDPYYVSIQNEPDYRPNGWEGCLFAETERNGLPGYDRALDAVSKRLEEANIETRFLAADTAHLQNGAVLRYASASDTKQIYGLAHHLYDGSDWTKRDAFYMAMSDIAIAYPDLPRFQTEFSPTQDGQAVEAGFDVARLIHNTMNYEGGAAYLHWELLWPSSGLVAVENPRDPSLWKTPEGYRVLEPYYSVRHYSRYTDPGDRVVANHVSTSSILATAYLSSDELRLTLVLLNPTDKTQKFALDLSGFEFTSSIVIVTTPEEPWRLADSLVSGASPRLSLASQGIMTLVLSQGELIAD